MRVHHVRLNSKGQPGGVFHRSLTVTGATGYGPAWKSLPSCGNLGGHGKAPKTEADRGSAVCDAPSGERGSRRRDLPASVASVNSAPASAAARAPIDGWSRDIAGMRKRICLADGEDPRFIRAGLRLQADGALTPVVIVRPAEVRRVGRSIGMPVPSDLAIHDPAGTAHAEKYGEVLADLLSDKRVSRQLILGLTTDPVYVAALMVRLGHVDGAVAGASRATADVIGAGLRVLGLASGSRAVTSCLLMALANGRTLAYGGWAVIPTPTPGQLADIAIQTASTVERLTGEPPIVALLSFRHQGQRGSREHRPCSGGGGTGA